jgi:tRNA(Ile)-lysidine synthase
MLLIKIRETIKKYSLLAPGDRVVIAVSGGPDSVCLLSVLHSLAKDLDLTLHVAHLDHMFRGKESAGEALFVEGLAKKFNIAATVETIDVPAFCRERGLSAQAGAREVRYRFLSNVAETVGATRIATGHTAADQAETFLMGRNMRRTRRMPVPFTRGTGSGRTSCPFSGSSIPA